MTGCLHMKEEGQLKTEDTRKKMKEGKWKTKLKA